jgi:hypothetical protein
MPEFIVGAITCAGSLGSSICKGTKSMPFKSGKTSLSYLAISRQYEMHPRFISYGFATPLTVAPLISLSATFTHLG